MLVEPDANPHAIVFPPRPLDINSEFERLLRNPIQYAKCFCRPTGKIKTSQNEISSGRFLALLELRAIRRRELQGMAERYEECLKAQSWNTERAVADGELSKITECLSLLKAMDETLINKEMRLPKTDETKGKSAVRQEASRVFYTRPMKRKAMDPNTWLTYANMVEDERNRAAKFYKLDLNESLQSTEYLQVPAWFRVLLSSGKMDLPGHSDKGSLQGLLSTV